MIGRGSRESRKKRRIVKRVGWEQYTAWTKAGRPMTSAVVQHMELNLNSLADEKAYQKRQAEMEKARLKSRMRARLEFLAAKPVKAPEPLKFYSAGSDDPEKDAERRKRRRSRDTESQGMSKMGSFSSAMRGKKPHSPR